MGTFRSLRHRNYLLYFLGQFVSISGSWLQTTALMWLAYQLEHKNTWPAAISAAQILPTFVLGVWGGRLADRWSKRKLIFITQGLSLLLALLLAGLVFLRCDSVGLLFAVALACGVVNGIDLPARMAFVSELVGKEDLMNAIALNSLLFNAARTLGPAAGGWLLPLLGPGLCFLVNGISFVAVLAALAAMDAKRLHATRAAPERQSLREGFRFLAARPWLLGLVLLSGGMALFGWPVLSLLPALVDRNLHADSTLYGTLLSAVGVGAMLAAFVVASLGSVRRWRALIGAGVILEVAGIVLLALARTKLLALACCGLIGCGLILYFATSQAVVQLSAGDHNRGLILGVWSMVLCGAQPLGNLLAGPAADRWGLAPILVGQALGTALAGFAVVLVLRGAGTLGKRNGDAALLPQPAAVDE